MEDQQLHFIPSSSVKNCIFYIEIMHVELAVNVLDMQENPWQIKW